MFLVEASELLYVKNTILDFLQACRICTKQHTLAADLFGVNTGSVKYVYVCIVNSTLYR